MSTRRRLIACDYNQLETRVAAFVSRDPGLMEIVNQDHTTPEGDLHAQNVLRMFHIPFDRQHEHKALRVRAKTDFFASLYGGQEDVILAQLEKAALRQPELEIYIPTKGEVKHGLRMLYATYPHFFLEYVPYAIDQARDNNCTAYTAFSRPRVIPSLKSPIEKLRKAAGREVISHNIQGTAADLARMAVLAVDKLEHGRLLLQIHDELVSEVEPGYEEEYLAKMIETMELGQPLDGVPLKVDGVIGDDWRACHK